MFAHLRVRMLFQSVVSPIEDRKTGAVYYWNTVSGQAMWELPKFMNGRLNHKSRAQARKDKKDDGSDNDADEGVSDSDSEAERLKRKMSRKYPR